MTLLRNLSVVVLLLILVPFSQAEEAEETPEAVHAQLTEYDNGVRLLVLPEPNKPLVSVGVYLSLRGAASNGGLAHFVEHLMFRSSKKSPYGSLRDSLQLLATFENAYTSTRHIKSTNRCLPLLLPRLLGVEAERFGQLQPDEFDIAHEKERILGEQVLGTVYRPSSGLFRRVLAMAFEESGTGDPLMGTPEMISAVDLKMIDDFIAQWFRTDRMVVLVNGPVDPGDVVAMVDSTFGSLAKAVSEVAVSDAQTRPDSRSFVGRSPKDWDLLMVGFRLPYGTGEEVAIVHFIETLMEKEGGYPVLTIFENEALLAVRLYGHWSEWITDEEAEIKAKEQFWAELKRVKHRVQNNWLFERNREANVTYLTEHLSRPLRLAKWRAQALADNRELPDPGVLAAMVDSLTQETIGAFFDDQLIEARSFSAFAAGRAPDDDDLYNWNLRTQRNVNPYVSHTFEPSELGTLSLEKVTPILAAAAAEGYGKIETSVLANGIPVHSVAMPWESRVYLGGARTFPCLEEEASDQKPGRMLMYSIMANWGYDRKGAAIDPRGDQLTRNTDIKVSADYMKITSDGPLAKFDNVTAVMHKRMDVARLNPYVKKVILKKYPETISDYNTHPSMQAYAWKMEKVFGVNHPLVGRIRPRIKNLEKWQTSNINRMHKQIFRTGNFQMVVSGDVNPEKITRKLDEKFGKLRDAEPAKESSWVKSDITTEGMVVKVKGSVVAVVDYMFPPHDLTADLALGSIDFLVMESIVEQRLKYALRSADIDSVRGSAYVIPYSYNALPFVRVTCNPNDAARVMDVVVNEMKRLTEDVPTEDEEAHARLQVMGPLVESMQDAESARDFYLECCVFGKVPKDPLDELYNRKYGVVSVQVSEYFKYDQHAWTVMGDTDLLSIRSLGQILD